MGRENKNRKYKSSTPHPTDKIDEHTPLKSCEEEKIAEVTATTDNPEEAPKEMFDLNYGKTPGETE